MELVYFFNIIKKHKFGLILIPIAVMAMTYFLVRKMPDVYYSKSRISSGITEKSQQLLQNNESNMEMKINQNFSNLLMGQPKIRQQTLHRTRLIHSR